MNCREFRKQFGYTLSHLSIETGYSVSAISKWERECETMPQDFVDTIYEKFNVVIDKQHRNFVFNKEYNDTVNSLKNEINELYKIIDTLQDENTKLKQKLELIEKICKE